MLEFIRQFFLNPPALLGSALISVPIIIYLINRHRHQRRKWAAMEFLLRAMKRNQRRIQVQNLLLLLLRTAVILLLVLAMARPVFRESSLVTTPEEAQNWVIAIDTSYSMGFEEGGVSYFDRARQTLSEIMDTLLKPGDRIALATFAPRPQVLLQPAPFSAETEDAVLRELEDLRLSAGSLNLGASFAVLDELCGKFATPVGPEAKRILIFSDFQRKDWLEGDGAPRDATILPTIEKIQRENGRFLLARMGYEAHPLNLAVTALTMRPPIAARDVWVEFHATVSNYGLARASNIDLSIQVDPDPRERSTEPQLGNLVEVPAGGASTKALAYRFDEPGDHTVVAELRSDGLLVDNRRFRVVRVEEEISILLVDGEPEADALERETFHVEVALEPQDDGLGGGSGLFTPFRPQYITFDQLGDMDLSEYAVVVLANVAEFRVEVARAIEDYVRAGGALMVFLGDRVNPTVYNHLLGSGEEPLMPFRLDDVQGDPRYPVLFEMSDLAHPVAAYFHEHQELMPLGMLFFYRYYALSFSEEQLPRVSFPFRFGDSDRSPAVVDNGYGKGRALWVTSSADQEWNEFARFSPFVVFIYESLSYLVRFGSEAANLGIGEPLRRRYDAAEYASEVMLHAPAPQEDEFVEATTLRKDMRELEGGNEFEITHERTDLPGLYRLELQRPNRPQPDTREFFAVNVDTSESDLSAVREEDFRASFESFKFQVFDATRRVQATADQQGVTRGREYFRSCLLVVLLLLALETTLACFFGRRVQ